MEIYRNYIDGQWEVDDAGRRMDLINPATGEKIGETVLSSKEDTRRAIAAARKSFYQTREWRDLSAPARADALLLVAARLEQKMAEIALLETINTGKPLREAEGDVADAASCFRYYAGLIDKPGGEVQDVGDDFGRMLSMTVQEPVGVVGAIGPWNYPLDTLAWKLAPALAAGNSVVCKPSAITPVTAVALFEILAEAGIPRGAANLVLGAGREVGEELARSADVDMVTFTGSTAVGQDIMRSAAGNVKKISLELGGKSPCIIFADADLENAVEWAMMGGFYNAGQVCSAGSRVLVEASVKDAFLARLAERTKGMSQGNPLKNPDLGSMVSREQMEDVLRYIETGKKEGAALVCGGCRNTQGECAEGYFIYPTIFDGCTSDMTIVREEVFGPVISVQTFQTEAEAVAMGNDSIYGLAGGVFTADGSRALRVVRELRAGITWINCYNATLMQAPWGGYKMSGIGRDNGVHGLREYQETKQINIRLDAGGPEWYSSRAECGQPA